KKSAKLTQLFLSQEWVLSAFSKLSGDCLIDSFKALKVRICKRCSRECSTLQKLCEHLKRKNLCKPLQEANQQPIKKDIQKPVQVAIQEPIQKNRDYISQKEADKWVSPNARKPGKYLKTKNLDDYMTLCHDLEQYNPEVVRPPTKEELKEEHEKRKLEEIKKRQERPKKDLEFREQEELEMA
ncbi:13154_t:CDS:2, partial [Racocetra persica]